MLLRKLKTSLVFKVEKVLITIFILLNFSYCRLFGSLNKGENLQKERLDSYKMIMLVLTINY